MVICDLTNSSTGKILAALAFSGELGVSILAVPMNGEIMTFIKEAPENIDELVKDANRKHSWKTRLSALNELRKYDCPQSRDVIIRLALHDKVYKVKEEAFRAAQTLD